MPMTVECRFCSSRLDRVFADLGRTPLSNSYLEPSEAAIAAEKSFPLKVMVCDECLLVQTTETVPAEEIFRDNYAYLSSTSTSWLAHAARYADDMTQRWGLDSRSMVVEVASNDGYLLRNFVAAGIPVLGIEPARNVAEIAVRSGVPTRAEFFTTAFARSLVDQGIRADLMAANNVLAHVPDIADFVGGFAALLKPEGVVTFEFPHLLRLMQETQFDTIYHEHYSYLSLVAVEKILASRGLRPFDVEFISTHGGSLRLYACHQAAAHRPTDRLAALKEQEREARLDRPEGYDGFAKDIEIVVAAFRQFVAEARARGETISAYGAAAKGNTFLNVCGIGAGDIRYAMDRAPTKQGKLLPGSHIPVFAPEHFDENPTDYVVILPWNIADEIKDAMARVRRHGTRFVTAIPALAID